MDSRYQSMAEEELHRMIAEFHGCRAVKVNAFGGAKWTILNVKSTPLKNWPECESSTEKDAWFRQTPLYAHDIKIAWSLKNELLQVANYEEVDWAFELDSDRNASTAILRDNESVDENDEGWFEAEGFFGKDSNPDAAAICRLYVMVREYHPEWWEKK